MSDRGRTSDAGTSHSDCSGNKTTETGFKPGEGKPPGGRGEYRVGEVMGRQYRVLGVRRGGMGLVYLVDDLTSRARGHELRLALKTFQERYLRDSQAMARFEREALNWVALGLHPHIVFAFLVQHIDARPYLWLELVDGESLAERLARGRLEPADAVELALQFVSGMRHAHEKHGLLHRDIKPANILLTKTGVLKITDFGLSKVQAELKQEAAARTSETQGDSSSGPTAATASGLLVGTPAYMAPEAIRDSSNVDGRADVYSFGVVLYEMLGGRCLFEGPNVLEEHLYALPVPLSARNHAVPPALDQLVSRCLEKKPERRYNSFAELESALQEVAAGLPVRPEPAKPRIESIPPKAQWFMKGFTLMEFGYPEEALRCYADALALDPAEAEVHNNMSLCLSQLGRLKEAAACAEKAVALRPDYAEAWANLGGFYAGMGRHERGLEACERALRLKPDWPDAHANRGVNLAAMGRLEEATACFDRALEVDPNYWKAYLMAAEACARRGVAPAEILPLLEKALAINPRDATALAFLAACLDDLGRGEEARHYLELAGQVGSNNPMYARVQQVLERKYRRC